MKLLKHIGLLLCSSITWMSMAQSMPAGISGSLQIINSIVDNDHNYTQLGSSVTATYSAIYGDQLTFGTGNQVIVDNIMFVDQLSTPVEASSYYLSPTSTLVNAANQAVNVPLQDINGNPRQYDGLLDIGPVEYSLIFNRANGNWNTADKWNIGRIPTQDDVVTVVDESTINNSDAVCKSIIEIGVQGKVIVEPTAQLEVKTRINNTHADRLHIKASSGSPNGTLIFHNAESNPVLATVEMWSKAYIDSECEQCPNEMYHWQFFGPPVHTYTLNPNSDFKGSAVRKYDESLVTNNIGQQWVQLVGNDIIEKFKGYEITHPEPKKIVFTGRLVNDDLNTGELAVTSGSFYKGWHLLSNPYTAAISIKDITFGTAMEETVYLYTTGSFDDWRYGTGDFGQEAVWNDADAVAPGQYLAIPKNLAGFSASTAIIPSMQGFMVVVNDRDNPPVSGKSVDYSYANSVGNTQQQRAPRPEAPEYVATVVTLTGAEQFDRAWMFTDDRCTADFDNGWDGKKIVSGGDNLRISLVQNRGENLQIHASDNINNTFIVVQPKPGISDIYTLHFKHTDLEAKYSKLFLYDIENQEQVDISGNGSTYSFLVDESNTKERHFKILTQTVNYDEINYDKLDVEVYAYRQKIAVQNYMRESGTIRIYDLAGNMLITYPLNTMGITTLPYSLEKGIYLVNIEVRGMQDTQKVLVH